MSEKGTLASWKPRWSGRFRLFVLVAVILASLGLGASLQREALLQGAADLWIVSDNLTRADAVVVLGGGYDVRPIVAADLYAKGLVQKVLVSQNQQSGTPGDTERNLQILHKLGVPDASIELFGNGSKNTRDEAVALRNWTDQHRTSALIVPVKIFFARRAR